LIEWLQLRYLELHQAYRSFTKDGNTRSQIHPSLDMNRNPFLAIYIFQSGSDFEEIVNQYMITGKGINPYNPRSVPLGPGNQGIGLNVTQEGAIVSLSSNVTLPLMNGSRLFSGSAEGVSSAGVPVGGAITPDPTLAA